MRITPRSLKRLRVPTVVIGTAAILAAALALNLESSTAQEQQAAAPPPPTPRLECPSERAVIGMRDYFTVMPENGPSAAVLADEVADGPQVPGNAANTVATALSRNPTGAVYAIENAEAQTIAIIHMTGSNDTGFRVETTEVCAQ